MFSGASFPIGGFITALLWIAAVGVLSTLALLTLAAMWIVHHVHIGLH